MSLAAVVVIYVAADVFEQENYPLAEDWYPTDIAFIIAPSIVIILGIILNLKYGLKGYHGKAWLFFTIAIVSWFIGELSYSYDYEYDIDDFSTLASDIFYILGYPFFFAFLVFYLKPRQKIITKTMIVFASLMSLTFVAPSIYISLSGEAEIDVLTMFFYVVYPVLGGIIFVPSIITVFLFFGGKVSLLWIMILLATILDIGVDTLYLVTSLDATYGPTHIINIFWIWSYILYAFGQYLHIRIFTTVSK
ncbi:hypothetical protein [Nitrosopumilus piranensis]|uniref:YhhN-like protein n=1 Tax=Nitrosopumilus piranensis TaxID=1582439 RepID=A0A0C5BX74_9ARCH|nr:hypothetical protein [Nitrosopumilus piranensis]AJM92916.1 conserved membrane protein of unknown function [Nitrosopumilus piranensis]